MQDDPFHFCLFFISLLFNLLVDERVRRMSAGLLLDRKPLLQLCYLLRLFFEPFTELLKDRFGQSDEML
jgi:hypothetical protein